MSVHFPARTLFSRLFLIAAVAITLVGVGWRLGNLGVDGFWHDEMITVLDTRDLAAAMENPHHLPLLPLLTYTSTRLLGESEFSARLPSAIAGLLAVPLTILFGAVAGRPRAGLWAALLLALSPFHLRYSQEARYYALLMTFSLVTMILLYLALTRQKVCWWLGYALFTVLNLYTHYGALVVLAWQSVVIGFWLLVQLRHGRYRTVSSPAIAALLVIVLYLPWLGRMRVAVDINTGQNTMGGTLGYVPAVGAWLREAFVSFGYGPGLLPFLIACLCLVGLVVWAWQRDWTAFVLAVVGLVGPFLLIALLDVARWPFPKYVIYVLPIYLLAAGVGLEFLLDRLARPFGDGRRYAFVALNVLVAAGLVAVTWPQLEREHEYAEGDWKAITQYLSQSAREGDAFVSMALDLPIGYNQGALVWPYYLDQTFAQYTFLAPNQLQPQDVENLAHTDGGVWLALLNRVVPVEFQEGTAEVTAFQNGLFVVQPLVQTGSDLETLMAMYEQMIPLAVAPAPQCLLKHDLATMLAVAGDYSQAERLSIEATTQCPEGIIHEPNRYLLLNRIYTGLEEETRAAGDVQKAREAEEKGRQVASELLRLGIRESSALASVAVYDLLQVYQSEGALVTPGTAPEPVQVQRFSMPQDGDWSDVLFVHSGASVSFPLTLPAEPTSLSFRAAMDPDSWNWGGDGSTFVVQLQTEAGEQFELYRQHISNDTVDRRWHEELLPLATYAGQAVTITLQTEPGPSMDYTGDWAGWGQPLIVLQP